MVDTVTPYDDKTAAGVRERHVPVGGNPLNLCGMHWQFEHLPRVHGTRVLPRVSYNSAYGQAKVRFLARSH